jgi:hypothetical protein
MCAVHKLRGLPQKKKLYYTEKISGSIVGWGTMLQARRSCVQFPMKSLDFSIDLFLPATLWPSSQLSF